MERTFAPKTEARKKSLAEPEMLSRASLSTGGMQGATAGMPLFLQRAAMDGQSVEEEEPEEQEEVIQQAPLDLGMEEEPKQNEDQEGEEKPPIQTKLVIGEPGDQYEQEANRVADQVMRMPAPDSLARVPLTNPNLPLASHQASLQRQEVKEEEEKKKKRKIQAKEESGQTPKVTSELEERLQASQGKGQPLLEDTRSFMESRFGQDFSQVRVHADSETAQINQALNAQAFTHRQNIFFGRGRYSPESREGKRLLAHELTHTVQQSQSSEQPILQRQDDPDKANLEMLDLTGIEWESKADSSSVLMLWGGSDLYLVPARGLVYTPKTKPGVPQVTGPVFGVPAAGHAGVSLVKTNQGTGMLLDFGGQRQGAENVLMPTSLAYLQSKMNIPRIDGAFLSHGHADHTANGAMLVQREQLKGEIYVMPGLEKATEGALGKLFDRLRDPSFKQFGKGPGWNPKVIPSRQIPGPREAKGITRGSLKLGDTELDFVVATEKLEKYANELAAGRPGRKYADSASPLIRITPVGSKFSILDIPDPRGADIKNLYEQMGETQFKEFVRDVKVLKGIQHHLGAVNSKADVEGIRILLKAVGPTAEPITVVVQADAGKNMDLIRALTEAGVRVVTIGEIDPAKPAKVTFTAKGDVRAERANVYEPAEGIRAAQQRIVNLIRAAEALEKYPDQLMGIGKTTAQLAEGLKNEAKRLRDAVDKRQELATSKLHKSTSVQNLDTQIKDNEAELKKVSGTESELGEEVSKLARFRTRADEIRSETEKSRARGESTQRLRQLIVEVEPKLAELILIEEQGQVGLSKREQRRATRRAIGRLRRQVLAQSTMQRTTPVGGFGKGVSVALLAIEVVNLAAPFITQYIKEKDEQKYRDFYTFLKILLWWQERGTSPPVVGLQGGKPVSDAKQLMATAQKRIWKDLPTEVQQPEAALDDDIRTAMPLEQFYVPDLNSWPAPVWDLFRNWITDNVKNFDDYASEFLDVNNPAIRKTGEYISQATWEIQTGKIEDGHVTSVWQQSPELTKIMQVTARRMIAGTEEKIEVEKNRRPEAPTNYPTIGPAISTSEDDPSFGATEGTVTGIAHFKKLGKNQDVYGHYQFQRPAYPFQFWTDNPVFLVYGNHRTPRSGYALVGGGDYNTYGAIRQARIWIYDPNETIKMTKERVKPYEVIPTEPELTEQEKFAKESLKTGKGEYHAYDSSHSIYRGEVRFPHFTPNVWGKFYVKRDELDIQPFSVQSPQQAAPPVPPNLPGPRKGSSDTPGNLGPFGPQQFGPTPGKEGGSQLPGVNIPIPGS